MGQPFMAFVQEEYGLTRKRAAVLLGAIVFAMCQPVILFNQQGFLGEFDFWAGTFGLVLFATIEIVLFAWVFGMDNAWEALTAGSDMKVPIVYRYIIQYVTPIMLLVILGTWVFDTLPPVLRYEGVNPDYIPYVRAARLTMIALFAVLCGAVGYAWRNRSQES
jgi:SNF family Na+-dependent transporter